MYKKINLFSFLLFFVIKAFGQPANDNCVGAISLTSSTTGYNFIGGGTTDATQSVAACSGTANDDVWYKFVATSSVHTITVRPSATFDPTFQLFTACGGTSLGCVNVSGPGAYETRTFTTLTVGVEYVLRVYDWNLPSYEGTKGFAIALQTGATTIAVPPLGWVWRGGTNVAYDLGAYGTKGVASTTNLPPSRGLGANWIVGGDLWLFGGGTASYNDLWKYDTTASTWTWVSGDNTTAVKGVYGTKGVADPANKPGGRSKMASWTSNNKLWLYGGYGYSTPTTTGSNYLGDLWQFDIATNQWTWISGSNSQGANPVFGTTGTPAVSNSPGAKEGGSSWTDADGNLWFFGGIGFFSTSVSSEGYSNDLWKYNPTTNEWTHVKGSKTMSHAGSYGTKGVANISNLPKARAYGHTWVDNNGDFWLYGGETAFQVMTNDVWKYNIASNTWTWMTGVSSGSTIDVFYDIKGVTSANVNPGGRRYGMTYKDKDGLLWFIGGHRVNGSFGNTAYMDGFVIDPAVGTFTWLYGIGECCAAANFGTKNVASASNTPGSRWGSFYWTDANGTFWFFGGSTSKTYNDLWSTKAVYKPAKPVDNTTSSTTICAGSGITLSAQGTGTLGWYDAAQGGNYLGAGNDLVIESLTQSKSYFVQDSTWTSSRTRLEIPLLVSVCTGTSGPTFKLTTELYPNPASDYFIINCEEGGLLRVIKIDGTVVLEKNIEAGENKILLNSTSQGLYKIVVQDSKGSKTGTLVVK